MIDLKSLSNFSSDIIYGLSALIIKIVSYAFDQWTHNPAFHFCNLYEVHLVQEWCCRTESSPVSMAVISFFFHCSATSFARGSSGLGALNNAWIESNTVRICRAGDHLSEGRGVQTKLGHIGKTRENLRIVQQWCQHRRPSSHNLPVRDASQRAGSQIWSALRATFS